MPTVPQLMTETQGLLKKAAKVTAHPDDIIRWFNELNRRLQPKAKIKRTWSLALVNGTEEYPLAIASYPIHALTGARYQPTGADTGQDVDLLPVDLLWTKGIRFQEALPGETAHTLWVYPTDYAGTLYLSGYLKLIDLANADTCYPQIREDFHWLYPLWAAARFGGQDEVFDAEGYYANYMREFLQMEAEFITAMSRGAHAGAHRIRREW